MKHDAVFVNVIGCGRGKNTAALFEAREQIRTLKNQITLADPEMIFAGDAAYALLSSFSESRVLAPAYTELENFIKNQLLLRLRAWNDFQTQSFLAMGLLPHKQGVGTAVLARYRQLLEAELSALPTITADFVGLADRLSLQAISEVAANELASDFLGALARASSYSGLRAAREHVRVRTGLGLKTVAAALEHSDYKTLVDVVTHSLWARGRAKPSFTVPDTRRSNFRSTAWKLLVAAGQKILGPGLGFSLLSRVNADEYVTADGSYRFQRFAGPDVAPGSAPWWQMLESKKKSSVGNAHATLAGALIELPASQRGDATAYVFAGTTCLHAVTDNEYLSACGHYSVQAASDGWHYAEGAYNAKNTGATDEGPFVSAVAAAAGLAQHIRTHKRVRPKRARMARLGPGNYIYEDEAHVFELQQPHAMFAEDPDRHWYGELDGEVMGPYDNKREAVAELQALLDQD